MILDVAIVGAGLSGLSAAVSLEPRLRKAGAQMVVFDKARAPGGRLATRRIEGYVFDHGAQFFTARSAGFHAQVDSWCRRGIVQEWCRGFPGEGSLDGPISLDFSDGHPRYFCPAGMTALAKDLVAHLPSGSIRFEQRVGAIHPGNVGWTLEIAGIDPVLARHVLVTVPVAQATGLFGDPGIQNACEGWASQIGFDPCLALMVVVEPSRALAVFPAPGARRFDGEVLSWGADNHRKGLSPIPGAITLHGSPSFSRRYFDGDPDLVVRAMVSAAGLAVDPLPSLWQLKKWRYATPVNPVNEGFVSLDPERTLHLAGDAFSGARVEGAWTSGRAAAAFIAGAVNGKTMC